MQAPKNAGLPGASSGIAAGLYDVCKFYDSLWGGNFVRALNKVTFEVRRGEVFGFLGPAGSGKSTAIKILAGKLRAMEGRAEVFGRSPRSGAARNRIGYLPERAKASAGTARRGLRESFNQLLGMRGDGETRSAGAGLMQALLNNPDLILLDDPFDGLDAARLETMKREIRALLQKGKTVILSSQSLSEAHGVCDRVAVFHDGKVEAVGSFEDLLAFPYAVNLLAPVMPAALSNQLVDVIREELRRNSARGESNFTAASAITGDLPANARATPAKSADPIDHDRLAELTKPASTESKRCS